MRVSISWLKQLVQVNESVEELSERLSMAGFEVDDVDDLSACLLYTSPSPRD